MIDFRGQKLRCFWILAWFFATSIWSCKTETKVVTASRPSDGDEVFPGFLESTDREITVVRGGSVESGRTKVNFPASSAASDFRVRLSRLDSAPSLSEEETAVIGDAQSDIIQIEIYDAATELILGSDQLLTPYKFEQTISESTETKNLGLMVVTEPGESSEQHFLLPSSELNFSEPSAALTGELFVKVSADLSITYAKMWLVNYMDEALSVISNGSTKTVIISGGKKAKPLSKSSATTTSTESSTTSSQTSSGGTGEGGSTSGSGETGTESGLALISTGGSHTCAIASNGSLWCWGNNHADEGQIGSGSTQDESILQPLHIGSDTDWIAVAGADSHTCALKSNKTLWCWGFNGAFDLGDNTQTSRYAPTQIGTDQDWAELVFTSAPGISCAKKINHDLYCWGSTSGTVNVPGGSPETFQTPTLIYWKLLAFGNGNACGIKADGTLWCWGNIYEYAPIQIGTDSDWTSVIAVREGSTKCALKIDQSLWCWGSNHEGQLGDGTQVESTSPIRVGSGDKWLQISTGYFPTICGIKSDQSLWCWGRNWNGRLGVGHSDPVSVPTQVTPGTKWSSVSVGGGHVCGAQIDGTHWCWGEGSGGKLGNGGNSDEYSPVQVIGY